MSELDPGEREFVDRMGLFMERVGGQRTMGRVYGWLMISDPAHQSLTELAQLLGMSKASASTVARHMQTAGMIERHPTSNREHRYRLTSGGWPAMLRIQFAGIQGVLETLDLGLDVVGDAKPEQRARLRDARDFLAFAMADADDLIRRWELHRGQGGER